MKKILFIIFLTSCTPKPSLHSVEERVLKVNRMNCQCDFFNNCECDITLSDEIPIYNRYQIEDYIQTKTKAKCTFSYE